MKDVTRRNLLTGSAAAVVGGAASTMIGAGSAAAADQENKEDPQSFPEFGPVTVRPDDQQYLDVIRGTNQRWVGDPDFVELVGNADHVVHVLHRALSKGKRVQVRSGGHCYENFVYNPEIDAVIDTSVLNKIYYDPNFNAFVVEAGAELRTVYETLYKGWGVTLPGGSCYAVGAGGHVAGAGYGLLSRQHATTVDYLYAVEVVVVDEFGTPRRIVATRESWDHHRELWWAHTGGGGGSFGVVTRYWFRDPRVPRGADPTKILPRPPEELFIHAIAWPWADITEQSFTRLLQNWGRWHEENSAPDSPFIGLFGLLKLMNVANGQIALTTVMDATRPDSLKLLNAYLDEVTEGVGVHQEAQATRAGEHVPMPQFVEPTPIPWFLATDALSGANPNLRFKNKSAYHRKGWTSSQIAGLYKNLTREDYDNPDVNVQIDSYGGQVNRVAPGETAQAHRDSVLKTQPQVYWTDPAEDELHVGFMQKLYSDVFADTGGMPIPNDVTDGCYINYPDVDTRDDEQNTSGVPFSTLYWKDGYKRLQRVKRRYDPRDVFRHGLSIEL